MRVFFLSSYNCGDVNCYRDLARLRYVKFLFTFFHLGFNNSLKSTNLNFKLFLSEICFFRGVSYTTWENEDKVVEHTEVTSIFDFLIFIL